MVASVKLVTRCLSMLYSLSLSMEFVSMQTYLQKIGMFLLAGLMVGCAGKMGVVYEDDFEDGAKRWGFSDPDSWANIIWETEEGESGSEGAVLSLIAKESGYRPEVRSPYHLGMLKGKYVSGFVLDVKVMSTHKDYGHRDVCLFFGYQDPTHFYYVHLAKKADDYANQIFIVNGAARRKITLTTTAGTAWDHDWHDVRIVRDVGSGEILVYFDDMDKPAMRARDDTFKWGLVGLGSFDDTADFDNFKLRGDEVFGKEIRKGKMGQTGNAGWNNGLGYKFMKEEMDSKGSYVGE